MSDGCAAKGRLSLGGCSRTWVLVWGLLAQLLNEVLKRKWGDSLGLRRASPRRAGDRTE